MMCDCRKQLESDHNGAVGAFIAKKYNGAGVQSIGFDAVAFPFTRNEEGAIKMHCVTTSDLKVTVEGKKRPVTVPVMHSYCPFCGAQYE